jgi:two-component system phosphate regulon sensor histidine kinase PhoR
MTSLGQGGVKRKPPLIWQLIPTYMLVVLVCLVGIVFYSSRSVQTFYKERIAGDLRIRAELVSGAVSALLRDEAPETVNAYVRAFGPELRMRITVILPDGTVLADNEQEPALMENHAQRAEVRAALATGEGESTRFSDTVKQEMIYYSRALRDENAVLGILRLAVPVERIQEALRGLYQQILYGGLAVALLSAGISLLVSRRLARPLAQMRSGAERFARGDFSQRLKEPHSLEMASLAAAMNEMARQLHERISTVISERNQQEAVLSSMVEGVLAVDGEERVLSFNAAAAQLAGFHSQEAVGQPIGAVVHDESLLEFVRQVLQRSEPHELEFASKGQAGRILQAHGTVLRDAGGHHIGAVVVLNDVTRLRRLEQVRRDFVANVSHELRTPITSIKGFVETLLDGALDDAEDARRFLEIVAKQADRLNALLADLLLLSHVEEGDKKAAIELAVEKVQPALQAAVQLCESKAHPKNIRIGMDCPEELAGRINPSLLEQAVSNLVDNAIKYSDAGDTVELRAFSMDGALCIEVEDHGCGIPEEHLPRLFERFYRVDKARSRRLGGTGLGLAIVKHIAKAHGGVVKVRSDVGVGTTFSLVLPCVVSSASPRA